MHSPERMSEVRREEMEEEARRIHSKKCSRQLHHEHFEVDGSGDGGKDGGADVNCSRGNEEGHATKPSPLLLRQGNPLPPGMAVICSPSADITGGGVRGQPLKQLQLRNGFGALVVMKSPSQSHSLLPPGSAKIDVESMLQQFLDEAERGLVLPSGARRKKQERRIK